MEYIHPQRRSPGAQAAVLILRLTNRRKGFEKQLKKGDFTEHDVPLPPGFLKSACNITSSLVEGRNVFTLIPKDFKRDKTILYLHGGGYVHNFAKQHWQFAGELLKQTGCTLVMPDYPLAPENTYREAFRMVESIYKNLVSGMNPQNLIIMGDSAGAAIGLALAQKMHLEDVPQPGQIILISPWLDFTLANPSIVTIERKDPLLHRNGIYNASRAYSGKADPNHYQLSPINGSFEGLAPISLFTGTHDILYPDIARLKEKMMALGIEMNYFEFPGMFHTWVLITFIDEAKAAMSMIKSLVE